MIYSRKYLSNGISHVVSWFIVTDLEKFGISLGANKGLRTVPTFVTAHNIHVRSAHLKIFRFPMGYFCTV